MAAPLVERTTNDLVPASDHNDVKDYIEDGTYRVNTLSLNIGGNEIIDSSGNITTDVGTVDGIDIGTDVAANTLKVTNATHSGEVTGDTALTIVDNIIDEANLKLETTPTNDYVLTADSTKSGGMKWAATSPGFLDPMTTRGDIIYKDPSNVTNRLALGTVGQVLTSDGTDASWSDAEVTSVFTRTGGVVAAIGDYTKEQITGLKTSDSPTFSGTVISDDGYIQNEDAYISGGGVSYLNLATNTYYSNGSWNFPGATAGTLLQLGPTDAVFYQHDGAGSFTNKLQIGTSITASSNIQMATDETNGSILFGTQGNKIFRYSATGALKLVSAQDGITLDPSNGIVTVDGGMEMTGSNSANSKSISVQTTAPSAPSTGDVWVDIS